MLVLVATRQGQDWADDFAGTVDGELVTPVAARCSSPDRCGCNRGFPGFASGRATTTAEVVELTHLTAADLRDVVEGALERDGWFDLVTDDAGRSDLVDEHLEAIAAVCAAFGVGTIVGRDGDVVFDRRSSRAA